MSVSSYCHRVEDHACALTYMCRVDKSIQDNEKWKKCFDAVAENFSAIPLDFLPSGSARLAFLSSISSATLQWEIFQGHQKVFGYIGITDLQDANWKSVLRVVSQDRERLHLLKEQVIVLVINPDELVLCSDQENVSYLEVKQYLHSVKSITNPDHIREAVTHLVTNMYDVINKRMQTLSKDIYETNTFNLIVCPTEKKQMIGVDTETKTFRRRMKGRKVKQFADHLLIFGYIKKALEEYIKADSFLDGTKDWLWLAGTLEGRCAASFLLMYPSFSLKNWYQRHMLISGTYASADAERTRLSSAIECEKSIESKYCMTNAEILSSYETAIIYYGKYSEARILWMEASFKAAQLIICFKIQKERARDFISAVHADVASCQDFDEAELIHNDITAANLFYQLNYCRISSYYVHSAALQTINPSKHSTHHAMLGIRFLHKTFPTYKINVKRAFDNNANRFGWMSLQHEMIYNRTLRLALKLQETNPHMGHQLEIWYRVFSLNTFYDTIDYVSLKQEMYALNESVSKFTPIPEPIRLDDDMELPPICFTNMPRLLRLELIPFDSVDTHPIIWQRQKDSTYLYRPSKQLAEEDVIWCQNEAQEIECTFYNFYADALSFEMQLLFDCDAISSTVKFQIPESTIFNVTFSVTPHCVGPITIIGYTCHVYNFTSTVMLSNLSRVVYPWGTTAKVIASLPQCSSESFCDISRTVYHGELIVRRLDLKCENEVSVSRITCSHVPISPYISHKELPYTLPISKDQTFSIEVKVSTNGIFTKNARNKSHTIEHIFYVRYTSEQGVSSNYGRQKVLQTSIRVEQSVNIKAVSCIPSKSDGFFNLVLLMHNRTKAEMLVTLDKTVAEIPPLEELNIILPVEKIKWQQDISFQDFICGVLTKMQPLWTLASTTRHGYIYLGDIASVLKVPSSFVSVGNIFKPVVQIDIDVNGSSMESEIIVKKSMDVPIRLTISKISEDHSISFPLVLRIKVDPERHSNSFVILETKKRLINNLNEGFHEEIFILICFREATYQVQFELSSKQFVLQSKSLTLQCV